MTAKWGITPSLVLSGTINPDFSQVEADAAQLDVNRQFALFFPELRPFFLEGADTFSTHLNVVHTRAVADPRWGLKVTGRQGRNALGVFVAEDDSTTFLFPGSEGSSLGAVDNPSTAAVLRYRRDFQRASSLGLIYTDRAGDDGYANRVGGLDGRWRFTDSDSVSFQILASSTDYPGAVTTASAATGQPEDTLEDWTGFLSYAHDARNWNANVRYQEVGSEFRADLGFIPQVDYRSLSAEGGYRWYGDADHWFTNLEIGAGASTRETQEGEPLVDRRDVWASYSGGLQSGVAFGYQFVDRTLRGVDLDDSRWWAEGGIQPTSQLRFDLGFEAGHGIDFVEARQGKLLAISSGLNLEVGRHLQARVGHTYGRLELPGSRRLFLARQTELRLVYQINLRAFVRAIIQNTAISRDPLLYSDPVDDESEDLFGQLLFSYKINPLTALYLGYTGAYLDVERSGLIETGNTLFFKVGYAWEPSGLAHWPAAVRGALVCVGMKRSNQSRIRGVTSISRRGSRGPCGVRG